MSETKGEKPGKKWTETKLEKSDTDRKIATIGEKTWLKEKLF